jgi:hypothetical protein
VITSGPWVSTPQSTSDLKNFKRSDTESQIKDLKYKKTLLQVQLSTNKVSDQDTGLLEEEVWDTMTKISELHHEINDKPKHDDCEHSEIGNMDSEQYYDKCLRVQNRLESLNGLKLKIEGELRDGGDRGDTEDLETRLWDVKTEISEVYHEVHQKPQCDEGWEGRCGDFGGHDRVGKTEFSGVDKGDGVEVEVIAVAGSRMEEMTQSDVDNMIKVLLEKKQDIEQKIVLNKTGAGLESIEDE